MVTQKFQVILHPSAAQMDQRIHKPYDPEFNAAVQMTGDGIQVQNDKVKKLLAKTDIEYDKEDSFWIYYGGYMKQPGIGGGGGIVQYQPYGTEQSVVHISYNKLHWTDVLRDWVYRYM